MVCYGIFWSGQLEQNTCCSVFIHKLAFKADLNIFKKCYYLNLIWTKKVILLTRTSIRMCLVTFQLKFQQWNIREA